MHDISAIYSYMYLAADIHCICKMFSQFIDVTNTNGCTKVLVLQNLVNIPSKRRLVQ